MFLEYDGSFCSPFLLCAVSMCVLGFGFSAIEAKKKGVLIQARYRYYYSCWDDNSRAREYCRVGAVLGEEYISIYFYTVIAVFSDDDRSIDDLGDQSVILKRMGRPVRYTVSSTAHHVVYSISYVVCRFRFVLLSQFFVVVVEWFCVFTIVNYVKGCHDPFCIFSSRPAHLIKKTLFL